MGIFLVTKSSGGGTFTSGGNISYGFAGAGANDATTGDEAWSDASNALLPYTDYATVTLNNNE